MAVAASIYRDNRFIAVNFYPGQAQSTILDTPDDRDWPVDGMYDLDKFEHGERELLGIEAINISAVTDDWLDELDKLDLPRVDIPDYGFNDAKLSDVLRWARARYGRTPQLAGRSR